MISAGSPLQQTPPGIFLRSIANCFGRQILPHQFLALLKHTLTHSSDGRNEHNLRTQHAEIKVLRGGPPFVEFDQLMAWAGDEAEKLTWVTWLRSAFEPLEQVHEASLADWLDLHRKTAEILSAGPMGEGSGQLWEKDAGISAKEALDQLSSQAHLGGTMTAIEYNALLKSVLAQELRTERQTAHPLISIWGTLEARVQTKQLVILGGLNEGIWPAKPSHDMWLNRDMRKQLGLLLPERRIGLAAHDFQQAIAAPQVVLSRAERDGEAPTTPSRWVIRLTNLLDGLGDEGKTALKNMYTRGSYWVELARTLDRPAEIIPAATRPSPIPPTDARLKKLSVTQIEKLVLDPYEIYARSILGLRKLDPLGKEASALERGNAIHAVMESFSKATQGALPEDAKTIFLDTAQNVLQDQVPWPMAQRLWLARLARVVDWFIANEQARRKAGHTIATERSGQMTLADYDFTLAVKADRIDQGETGLRLYDYKAGNPPKPKDITRYNKQLQLEALIAQDGGFDKLPASTTEHLCYIGLHADQKEHDADIDTASLIQLRAELCELIQTYADPTKGFTAHDKARFRSFDSDFDHLARFGEWQDSDEPDPRPVP